MLACHSSNQVGSKPASQLDKSQQMSQPVNQTDNRVHVKLKYLNLNWRVWVLPTFPKSEWTLRCCSGWTDVGGGAIIDCDVIPVQEATSSFLCSPTNMTTQYCPNEKLHISLQSFSLLRGMERERPIHAGHRGAIQEFWVLISGVYFFVILNQDWHTKAISVPDVHTHTYTQDRAQEVERLYSCRKLFSI